MATKVVYFLIDGREEQAEFRSDDESEDVRGKEMEAKSSQLFWRLLTWELAAH